MLGATEYKTKPLRCKSSPRSPGLVCLGVGYRACKWNRKRSPFMSAKLSHGDIMATEMHASYDSIMNISCN